MSLNPRFIHSSSSDLDPKPTMERYDNDLNKDNYWVDLSNLKSDDLVDDVDEKLGDVISHTCLVGVVFSERFIDAGMFKSSFNRKLLPGMEPYDDDLDEDGSRVDLYCFEPEDLEDEMEEQMGDDISCTWFVGRVYLEHLCNAGMLKSSLSQPKLGNDFHFGCLLLFDYNASGGGKHGLFIFGGYRRDIAESFYRLPRFDYHIAFSSTTSEMSISKDIEECHPSRKDRLVLTRKMPSTCLCRRAKPILLELTDDVVFIKLAI
ncbi:hypothetical protein Tsubulata_028485 [Turnera subulata]|uniref:Uncharacterized protein n=1 Tax=Turnera subulata TaxID=218843 RepID=A0A9Q0FJ46_9ROSI|nr:hypothetical protein Tsubulata_028485 [Turnera subulata]